MSISGTKKIIVLAVAVVLVGVILLRGNNNVFEGKPIIATSFYPLYFFASSIVGDKMQVINITPSGAEPHEYEPSSRNIATIEDSQLLIINGAHFEPWGERMKYELQNRVLEVSSSLAKDAIVEDGKEVTDPHVWLDPVLAKKIVDQIQRAVVSIDPANEDYYIKQTNRLLDDLDKLDQDFRNGLQDCQNRNLVTSHAAFGYLAKEYNLKQVAIAGVSPEEEPSLQKLAEVASFVKKNGVNYIFFESLVSPKFADTIARETGAKTLVLNPLEGLTPDEMASGKNYYSVMRENLSNLRTALTCH